MGRILIVDDEPNLRKILAANLRKDGHLLSEASGCSEAKQLLARDEFDVVLTDQKMPDGSGMDVLRAIHEDDSTTSVVFLTAVGTVQLAVESMREGAFDFLTKPFTPEVVRSTVNRACERTALLRENAVLKTTVRKLQDVGDLLGTSPEIETVRALIERVAKTSSTVLITGETGTGKELVAKAIHRKSLRAKRPFIAINCAAVSETLLESELFGHERGAFTGADKARAGLFEAAHEGTLFLDEVAEMSLAAQAKLLRVLADGEIQRVGSTQTRRVDVRVLAATHQNLQDAVQRGSFREDLFYRLAVVPIHLPPLRDRKEDLGELCRELLERSAFEMKVPPRPLSAAALAKLGSYSFPGNIRELRNLIERALILGRDAQLQPEDFPFLSVAPEAQRVRGEVTAEQLAGQLPAHIDLRETIARFEQALIVRALDEARGVQAEAARKLSLSRSDLGYKLGKYGISVN